MFAVATRFWRWYAQRAQRTWAVRCLLAVLRFWRERLTPAGRILLLAGVSTVVAGSFPDMLSGAAGFSAFAALALLGLAGGLMGRLEATATLDLAPRCIAGSDTPLGITVRNDGRRRLLDLGAHVYRLAGNLRLAGDVQFVPELEAGRSHRFDYRLHAGRRGAYEVPGPSVLSAFPFGVVLARRHFPGAQRLLVYPRFHRLARLDLPTGLRHQPGGIALTSKVGESLEFIGNREYHPGDRLRDLHPRSWARVGYPVVKQFQEEYLTRIALLVDTFVPAGLRLSVPREARGLRRILWTGLTLLETARPLEANLSLSAAIADYLARQEYIVDLFAAGPELYHFQAGRALGYLDNILDILACIERCPSDPLEVVGPRFRDELKQISTVVVLLLSWDKARDRFVRSILDAGVQVKLIVVSDNVEPAALAGAPAPATVLT